MAPEIYAPKLGVVNKSCLYAWRFVSVFSRPIDASRLPQVAFDSSIARIPRPGEAIDFYKKIKLTASGSLVARTPPPGEVISFYKTNINWHL